MSAARPIRSEKHQLRDDRSSAAGEERLTPLREMQLLEQHRAGGSDAQDALCELLRGYQRRIYSICIRMVRHPDDAADLTQDVLIKVIEGLPSYNGKSKLSTWVIRVAMNCCFSFLRRRKLRSHQSLDAPAPHDDSDAGIAGSGESSTRPSPKSAFLSSSTLSPSGAALGGARELSPAMRIEQEQTRAQVVSALNSLDIESRALLVLRDVQDLDYQQIAEVLDVPLGTVKSRLFRARAALRLAIETDRDLVDKKSSSRP